MWPPRRSSRSRSVLDDTRRVRSGPRSTGEPAKPRKSARPGVPPVRSVPTDVIPRLTASGYVFPIYGQASFTDSFNAPRATTGWHHGEDIFAPLGAPVLAVADGIVYSVGWNKVGGLRFWLQDLAGNEFYYAHLSAFSPLAINGAQVRAGDVIGFVGNTGDAEHTPYHLHFEIHPVSLLYRGYDGSAVPPHQYRRLEAAHGPAVHVSVRGPPLRTRAERRGAILLQSRDISSGSGPSPARSSARCGRKASPEPTAPSLERFRAHAKACAALARQLSGPEPSRLGGLLLPPEGPEPDGPSSPPSSLSEIHWRVAGPVTGLKRMPSAMPAISRSRSASRAPSSPARGWRPCAGRRPRS